MYCTWTELDSVHHLLAVTHDKSVGKVDSPHDAALEHEVSTMYEMLINQMMLMIQSYIHMV